MPIHARIARLDAGACASRPAPRESITMNLPDNTGKPAQTAPVTIIGGGPEAGHEAATRIDRDSLGSMEIPADVYWGIHTARALENFPITRRAISTTPTSSARSPGSSRRRRAPTTRSACSSPAKADIIDAGLRGDRRGRAARPVRRRRHPGRRRHEHQHERQRGHRQPRPRADGASAAASTSTCTRSTTSTAASRTNDVYPTAIKLAMVFGIQRLLEEHAPARPTRSRAKGARVRRTSSRSAARSCRTPCR